MFTKFEENVSIHQGLANEPNIDNGLSAEELKKLWDKPAEELKAGLNKLMEEIMAQTGASDVGALPLTETDESDKNVQAKLELLYSLIQNAALGAIPDGTITANKLDSSILNKINDLISLSGKYNNPEYTVANNITKMTIQNGLESYEEGQKVSIYVKPVYEDFSENIFPTTFENNGFSTDNVKVFNGSGYTFNGSSVNEHHVETTIKCPIAINPSEFAIKLRVGMNSTKTFAAEVYGSNDEKNWTKLATYSGSNDNTTKEYVFANTKPNNAYKCFKLILDVQGLTSSYSAYLYMFNVPNGEKSTFNEYNTQTVNVGGLGDIPVIGRVKLLQKQSLMYINGKFLADDINNEAEV